MPSEERGFATARRGLRLIDAGAVKCSDGGSRVMRNPNCQRPAAPVDAIRPLPEHCLQGGGNILRPGWIGSHTGHSTSATVAFGLVLFMKFISLQLETPWLAQADYPYRLYCCPKKREQQRGLIGIQSQSFFIRVLFVSVLRSFRRSAALLSMEPLLFARSTSLERSLLSRKSSHRTSRSVQTLRVCLSAVNLQTHSPRLRVGVAPETTFLAI
jgi:hypothetical protein